MKEFITHECNSRRLHLTPKGFEDGCGNVFNTFRAKFIWAAGYPDRNRVELGFSQNGEDFSLDLDSESRDGRFVQSAFAYFKKPCGRVYSLYATPSALTVAIVLDSGEERNIVGYKVDANPSTPGYICAINANVEEPYYGPDEDPYDDGSDPSC